LHAPNSEYAGVEQPAVQLFQKLGYEYYNAGQHDQERKSINETVLVNRLKASLKRINPWLNDNNLNIAARKMTAVHDSSLIKINRQIHKRLQGPAVSVSQLINGKKIDKSISYIDYANIANNDFLIVNQMTFSGKHNNSKPDIVVYVNGLPLGVIECKSPTLSSASAAAVNDLRYYQENSPKLFHHNQLCVGIYKVGGKYGPIGAGELHYNLFKSTDTQAIAQLLDREATAQDILLYNLFKKENLLDIIRNFIIFEKKEGALIKKLPRYPQLRAVNKTIAKLKTQDKGGVIWHTQGSGKSLTMVFLATKLRRDEQGFKNPIIIVMTDRTGLDEQISQTFKNSGYPNPIQARSINHLRKLLNEPYGKTIMTTIQKFQEKPGKTAKDGTTASHRQTVGPDGQLVRITTVKDPSGKKVKQSRQVIDVPRLSPKENIFVFVDEAHRSHYGFLAAFMRKSLPNARFIAFTGTPIDKENKSTLAEFYGGRYLDTYTIKESVADGATLPILYDAGLPELHVENDLIDQQFETAFQEYNREQKERLRQKASSLGAIMNARQRIERIAEHIIEHYREHIHPNGFKAMVVCHGREAAAIYKDSFDKLSLHGVHNFSSQLIMTLDIKKDPECFKQLTTPPQCIKKAVENFKLPFGTREQQNDIAITIVCDMLLTGYDAPIVQVMYLDKLLAEHNLLQAIARVNRGRAGKDCGFIIDYCGITRHLSRALAMFSDDLSPGDIMEKISGEIDRLGPLRDQLVNFFDAIEADRVTQRGDYTDKAVLTLEPEERRDEFKRRLKEFNRSLNILLPSPEALEYRYDFKLYNEIKLQAANMYLDDTLRTGKEERRKIQALVDEHLAAAGIRYLLDQPVSIIDREKFDEEINKTISGKSRELKIINRLRCFIKTNMDKNPEFYRPLSKRLEELVEMRKKDRLEQLKLFQELDTLQETIAGKEAQTRELGLDSEAEFAVYKTLEPYLHEKALPTAAAIFQGLAGELKIRDWADKPQVQKTMRRKIKDALLDSLSPGETETLSGCLLDVIRANPLDAVQ
jgi:type I restriction enzyme R subunit